MKQAAYSLLLCVYLAFLPSVARAQMPLEIAFDGIYTLPLELRQPVRALLERHAAALPETRYAVSAYRDAQIDGVLWAKITLVPTRTVEAGWTEIETLDPFVIEIVAARRADGAWIAYWLADPAVIGLAQAGGIPRAFVDSIAARPALAGGYRLPWRAPDAWWAIQTWHGGNALDFQPTVGAQATVLAMESGHLRELCSDGTQSLLQIRHADGRATYYLHVTLSLRVRRLLLDQNIERGQILGELIRYAPFVTPCGRGFSRHLHLVVSDRALLIEGLRADAIAAVASCCANPPLYRSSNAAINRALP
jgi:hypothetical protein